MNEPAAQPSVDRLLSALSNAQRRELPDSLVADSLREDDEAAGTPVAADVTTQHVHLPKLVDYSLVNWDREANRVTKGTNFRAAKAVLELLANTARTPDPREVNV